MSEHKPSIWLACDPGKTGGIVAIDKVNQLFWTHTPVVAEQISVPHLKDFLWSVINQFTIEMCVVEDVHAIFGSSAKSNFEFGRSLGILESLVSALEIPWVKIAPKTWQKLCHQGIPKMEGNIKGMSLLAAQRLLPGNDFTTNKSLVLPTTRASKQHDGIIDAALMAFYCKQNYSQQNT